MKRLKIDDDGGDVTKTSPRQRRRKPFLYIARERRRKQRLDKRPRNQIGRGTAPAPADTTVLRLMNDIALARATERLAWTKLQQYLSDGITDDGRRVRLPILRDERRLP